MSTKKTIIGGIAGGITYFVLGWLVYGMLLMDFMRNNAGSATGVQREQDQIIFWSLALGNLCMGFLLSYIIHKANASSPSEAAGIGAVTGLLMSAGFDFIMYGTSNIANLTATIVDIAVLTVMSGITGMIIALVSAPKRRIATA